MPVRPRHHVPELHREQLLEGMPIGPASLSAESPLCETSGTTAPVFALRDAIATGTRPDHASRLRPPLTVEAALSLLRRHRRRRLPAHRCTRARGRRRRSDQNHGQWRKHHPAERRCMNAVHPRANCALSVMRLALRPAVAAHAHAPIDHRFGPSRCDDHRALWLDDRPSRIRPRDRSRAAWRRRGSTRAGIHHDWSASTSASANRGPKSSPDSSGWTHSVCPSSQEPTPPVRIGATLALALPCMPGSVSPTSAILEFATINAAAGWPRRHHPPPRRPRLHLLVVDGNPLATSRPR